MFVNDNIVNYVKIRTQQSVHYESEFWEDRCWAALSGGAWGFFV